MLVLLSHFRHWSNSISELEINIKFPTCWDGKKVESADGSHVAYSSDCNGNEHNECFDFDCPSSHPIKMPELHLYVRVQGYEGGAHMFADGSDVRILLLRFLHKQSILHVLFLALNFDFYLLRFSTVIIFPDGMKKNFKEFWTIVITILKLLTPMLFVVIG